MIDEVCKIFNNCVGKSNEPVVIFLPNEGVYVEGKNEILILETKIITFKTKKGILEIVGNNLMLHALEQHSFFVKGNVVEVKIV